MLCTRPPRVGVRASPNPLVWAKVRTRANPKIRVTLTLALTLALTLTAGGAGGGVAAPEDAARALGLALHRGPLSMRHWWAPDNPHNPASSLSRV